MLLLLTPPPEGGRALSWMARRGWWRWPWPRRAPSRRWCDSGTRGSSSSRSRDPLGISRMTGGKSSRGMREVELSASCWSSHGMREAKSASSWSSHGMREVKSATGGSSPTSSTRSGWAKRGSDCGWWNTEWQLLWGREKAPPWGSAWVADTEV